jgi:tetratricopeptide (TPR) repeat protein
MKQVFPAVSVALNRTLLAGLIAVSPVLVNNAVSTIAPDFQLSVVHAQVTAKNKYAGQDQRKFPNVTEAFGKKITEAANFLQPQDESVKPDPRKAMQLLNQMEANTAKANAYEQVLLHQYTGYAHLAMENYTKAIESFNKMLALSPNMPLATESTTVRIVGQLYSQVDNPRKALETLLKWTDYADKLKPEDSYMFATLYYQLDDSKNALLNINEAIKVQEAAGKVPAESWFTLQRGLLIDKEDYKGALTVTEKLIKHYSKAQYWKNLSQLYRMLDRTNDAINALETCYLMGGLTTEKDIINLAYSFLEAEVPYKAAKVLRKGIYTDKIVEPTAKNLKTLADALRLAQNSKESLVEYERAAQKSTDGELIIGLAQAYLANDKYKDASKWGRDALRKGGIKRVDYANLTVAQAEFELKNYDEAIKFFREASKDARSAKVANQWIAFCEREKQKLKIAKEESES